VVGDTGIDPVGGDANGPLQVGAPQGGTVLAVTIHDSGVGVVKGIETSAGDDDVFGTDRPNEIRVTRCPAAMVRSLQDFCV